MQVSTCVCNGTRFRLASPESRNAIQELMHEHMDGYLVDFDEDTLPDGSVGYYLGMDTEDVGDSFRERLEKLIAAMAPHVLDAFRVTVRTDSMNDDDRDLILFGGPSNQAILEFQTQCAVKDAMELLRGTDLKAAMLAALLEDPALQEHLPVPRVFATVEGGVLQSVVSTHPLDMTLIDYDTDGCDEGQLTAVPQGGESGAGSDPLAEVVQMDVLVDADRCAELGRATDGARKAREVFLGFSADGYWNNDQGWVESAADATEFDETEALNLRHLTGSGVCVLKVDRMMRGALPIQDDLLWRIERLMSERQGGAITEEDKANLLHDMKVEFPLLNEDPSEYAPAVLALLAREESASRRPAQRPQ